MKVIDKCPSGALSYTKVDEKKEPTAQDQNPVAEIRVAESGPLMVKGECLLVDSKGKVLAKRGPFALCRCGGSKNMPYCDGTHRVIGFDDTTKTADEQQ
jgi:CDGSH-type Zn-finger protein